ncbi:MAG: hypothetical protein CVU87_01970 [Firmicutes bacterium HGW-Firmicutes-12]|jgi:hypothetical protein|nr:MAG: hypothetical protein CVU87_01970 [Firmicutes bacterium HGW-Firmicutes-12]
MEKNRWNPAFILPELRERFIDDKKEIKMKPQLDDQEIEYINYSLTEALESGKDITLLIWSPEGLKKQEVSIMGIQGIKLKVSIKNKKNKVILLEDIISVIR